MTEPQTQAKPLGLRERQRILRRESILAAAGDLFASQSFAEVTLEAVAAGAEVSVPTIYTFFKSKHELLLGLLEEDRRILEPKLAQAVESLPADPGEALLAVTRIILLDGYDISRKMIWREILSATVQVGSEPRNQFREMLSLSARYIRTALVKLRAAEAIDGSADLDSAVRIIQAVITHVFSLYLSTDEATVEDLISMLSDDIQTVVSGLSA